MWFKKLFKKKEIISFVIFLILGLSIYVNSFDNQFFWDDDDLIVNNPYVKEIKHFPKFFTKNIIDGVGQISNYYRPVLMMSFSFDYHIWKLNPIGFHLTNTFLHIFVTCLVFLLLCKLFQYKTKDKDKLQTNIIIAFFVSLFFLVHPLQTEAITYMAGRGDPLSAVFSLLMLLFYVNYKIDKNKKNYFYSILFFVLGLLTKEQVVLMPAVVLLIELVFFTDKFNKNNIIKALKNTLVFFVIAIFYLGLRLTVLNFKDSLFSFSSHEGTYDSSAFHRLLTFSLVMFSYLKLLFIPTDLHMAREVSLITSVFSPYVIGFLFLIGGIVSLCIKTWNKNRFISFGFLWFFGMLLPRSNILKINRPMYEHWLYLPMIGFWLAFFSSIFLLFNRVRDSKERSLFIKFFYFILIIYILFFSVLTIKRNKVWHDPITFYEYNLEYTPNSFIQHNNLGMAYSNKDRILESIKEYKRSLEIKDYYPQVHYNLAISLVKVGKIEEAIQEFKKSIEISPGFQYPYVNLINIYIRQGNKEEAKKVLKEMNRVFNTNMYLE